MAETTPEFGWINLTTLVLYLAAMVLIGVYWSFQNRSTDEFFRGGQQVPWWAAGLSIFATLLSSITFMAISSQSFANGSGFFLQNSFFRITPLIVWVYLPFFRQLNVTTRDERAAVRAIWGNALISPLASGLFFLIGTALWVFYSVHPEKLDPAVPSDAILPFFVFREVPAGVAGLVVAGVFGAAQSTLSSSMNSIAACYVVDFHRLYRPSISDLRAVSGSPTVPVPAGGSDNRVQV